MEEAIRGKIAHLKKQLKGMQDAKLQDKDKIKIEIERLENMLKGDDEGCLLCGS